tara:strand:+ start:292 stop:1326 length:1035 start_codon:yes stop_codon:yes gene_type:complete
MKIKINKNLFNIFGIFIFLITIFILLYYFVINKNLEGFNTYPICKEHNDGNNVVYSFCNGGLFKRWGLGPTKSRTPDGVLVDDPYRGKINMQKNITNCNAASRGPPWGPCPKPLTDYENPNDNIRAHNPLPWKKLSPGIKCNNQLNVFKTKAKNTVDCQLKFEKQFNNSVNKGTLTFISNLENENNCFFSGNDTCNKIPACSDGKGGTIANCIPTDVNSFYLPNTKLVDPPKPLTYPTCQPYQSTVWAFCNNKPFKRWGIGPEGEHSALGNCNYYARGAKGWGPCPPDPDEVFPTCQGYDSSVWAFCNNKPFKRWGIGINGEGPSIELCNNAAQVTKIWGPCPK